MELLGGCASEQPFIGLSPIATGADASISMVAWFSTAGDPINLSTAEDGIKRPPIPPVHCRRDTPSSEFPFTVIVKETVFTSATPRDIK